MEYLFLCTYNLIYRVTKNKWHIDILFLTAIIVSYDTVMVGGDNQMGLAAIQKILKDMRDAIDNGKFYPIDRDKNMRTLALLGIPWEVAKEEIYELTEADYFCGPKVDRDYPTTDFLWEFKKDIDGHIIYIKFKVLYQEDGGVRVLGFHLDKMK